MKNFKKKLKNGKTSVGAFISLGSPIVTEIIGQAGFDFVIFDLEHGSGNERDILGQLQALEPVTTASIVRVESHERQRVGRVLDLGAEGHYVPAAQDCTRGTGCNKHLVLSARWFAGCGKNGPREQFQPQFR